MIYYLQLQGCIVSAVLVITYLVRHIAQHNFTSGSTTVSLHAEQLTSKQQVHHAVQQSNSQMKLKQYYFLRTCCACTPQPFPRVGVTGPHPAGKGAAAPRQRSCAPQGHTCRRTRVHQQQEQLGNTAHFGRRQGLLK